MKDLIISNCGLLLLSGCFLGASASGKDIEWRVSVKFICDSAGARPSSGVINTPQKLQEYIDYGNWVLAHAGRGYQLKLVEILDVFGQSSWFDINGYGDGDNDGHEDADELKVAVFYSFNNEDNAFLYNPEAINIYIVSGNTDGSCSCGVATSEPEPDDLIVLSQDLNPDWVVLHEIGHFLGLSHTHSGSKGLNADGTSCEDCNCSRWIAGDDDIEDTLPDHDCWDTADLIATNNFDGRIYASLSLSEQQLVGNTLSNIMSYHGSSAAPRYPITGEITGPADRSILTEDQLDKITDWSNGSRSYVTTARTYFVDQANTDSVSPAGDSRPFEIAGSWFGGPLTTIAAAVARASAQDIVLIRPGTYTDTTVFNRAMTFRATRGNAVITF